MTNQRYHPDFHDGCLTELYALKRSDQMIADAMGFDKTTIRKQRLRLGLATHQHARPIPLPTERPGYIPNVVRSPVSSSIALLGSRVEERIGKGYFLDGRPASSWDLVRVANALRKAKKIAQVGPEHCHV